MALQGNSLSGGSNGKILTLNDGLSLAKLTEGSVGIWGNSAPPNFGNHGFQHVSTKNRMVLHEDTFEICHIGIHLGS